MSPHVARLSKVEENSPVHSPKYGRLNQRSNREPRAFCILQIVAAVRLRTLEQRLQMNDELSKILRLALGIAVRSVDALRVMRIIMRYRHEYLHRVLLAARDKSEICDLRRAAQAVRKPAAVARVNVARRLFLLDDAARVLEHGKERQAEDAEL